MRLIDADELKKCAIPCEIHNGALTDLCIPLYQIDNAPTVGLHEGQWVESREGLSLWVTRCSECGERAVTDDYGYDMCTKYCPNCGAKMKK